MIASSTRPAVAGREVVAVIEEAATARRCLTVAQRAARLVDSLPLAALHICVDPAKLITHRFALDEMMEAYEVFGNAAREKAMKVILSA